MTDFSKLSASEFEKLAKLNLSYSDEEYAGDFLLNPDYEEWVVNPSAKPAAVLIPIVERSVGLSVILTKRTERLKSHSGQIAFPGGKIDKSDKNAQAAALREAHEEIDLEPHEVSVVGRLPNYFSGSGFKISPIIGLINSRATICPSPNEVEYIFEVPLAFLMDAKNHKTGSRMFEGSERFYFEMPFNEHYIWGVTAGIVKNLHDRLKQI